MNHYGGIIIMKSLIYRNPVISAITINLMIIILNIYSINQRIQPLTMSLILLANVNKRIIEKGQNIDKQKKTIIYISFFSMIITNMAYIMYMYIVRKRQLINGF